MLNDNYAILRVGKIKGFASLSAMQNHWDRTNPTPNADPNKTHLNFYCYGSATPYSAVKNTLDKKGITKLRSNGVLALEFVCAFSPTFLKDEKKNLNRMQKNSLRAG